MKEKSDAVMWPCSLATRIVKLSLAASWRPDHGTTGIANTVMETIKAAIAGDTDTVDRAVSTFSAATATATA